MYITRLASIEIFSPSNKMHREVGRAKDLSTPLFDDDDDDDDVMTVNILNVFECHYNIYKFNVVFFF